jgi:hypothetical protein
VISIIRYIFEWFKSKIIKYHFSGRKKDMKTITLTRWVKLDYLNFNIIYWSVKDKFIDKLD